MQQQGERTWGGKDWKGRGRENREKAREILDRRSGTQRLARETVAPGL